MSHSYTFLESLPDGFFELEIATIRQCFEQPTLIYLQGQKSPPLFVSILLHGNEYSGLKAMQRLLAHYADALPRSLYLFVGNVYAAEKNLRVLPQQVDFNRCWPGTEMLENDTTRMMQSVIDRVSGNALFAAIDVHNNTGLNPHYACMTSVTRDNQHLAAMFNHVGMVFKRPKGVSTMAFDGVCPAVTLECGKPGDELGITHVYRLLDALMHLDHFPERAVAPHDLQLVQSLATLNVPDDVTFEFDRCEQADLTFDIGFERKNFTEIKPTDTFAFTRVDKPLRITNQQGEDVTEEIMRIENGQVYLNRTLMPAMITLDKSIVRQDCLCYLLTDYNEQELHH